MSEPRTEAGRRLLDDIDKLLSSADVYVWDNGVDAHDHFAGLVAALTDERVEAFERDFGVPHPSRLAALPVPALDALRLIAATEAVLGTGEVSTRDGSMGTDYAARAIAAAYDRLAQQEADPT